MCRKPLTGKITGKRQDIEKALAHIQEIYTDYAEYIFVDEYADLLKPIEFLEDSNQFKKKTTLSQFASMIYDIPALPYYILLGIA